MVGAAEFVLQSDGLGLGGAIAEGDTRTGLAKEADCGGANAARASGDEGDAARQREYDAWNVWSGHGHNASRFRWVEQAGFVARDYASDIVEFCSTSQSSCCMQVCLPGKLPQSN